MFASTVTSLRRSEPSQLASLLVAAVNGGLDLATTRRLPAWSLLPSVARHHRVAPAVYQLVGNTEWATTPCAQALRVDAAAQAETRLRMGGDLAWLHSRLQRLGVPWAVFKGPVLDGMWPRPGMRQFHDLDILVPPAAFADTLADLEAGGAHLLYRNWPLMDQRRYAEISLRLPHGTVLDLHWDPVWDASRRRRVRFPVTEMLGRSPSVTIDGTVVRTFDPIDTLLHTAHHAASGGGHRLSWIKDVQVCANVEGLDWEEVTERAGNLGLGLVLAVMLARAARVLPGFRAPEVAVRPAQETWGRILARLERRYPPPRCQLDRRSGALFYACTEASTADSVLTLVRSLPSVDLRRHQPAPPQEADLLGLDRPDERARLAYLAAVASSA